MAADASIPKVIFDAGTYSGGVYIDGPKNTDSSRCPLLIRAADGARVVFDGSMPVEKFQPDEKLDGVFWIQHINPGGESPKLWESRTRIRYRLVADRQAVARFPSTFTIEGNRLLFRASDG